MSTLRHGLRQVACVTVICAATAALLSSAAPAQTLAPRTIKVLMPYAAGGPWDVMIRTMAKSVGDKHSRDIIVENRPGANTIVGANACKSAPADGHTICVLAMPTMLLNPLLRKSLSYHPENDFEPVTMIAYVDHVVLMNKSLPVNTLQELVAYSKANPDKINYASNGVGGDAHLLLEWIKAKTGAKFTHIPFQGMAPAMTAIEGGHAHLLSLTPGVSVVERINQGDFKGILVDTDKRLSILPNVPSISESGLPPFQARGWLGFFVPKGTPSSIVATLNAEFAAVIKDPEFQKKFLFSSGFFPVGGSPEQLRAEMRDARDAAAELVKISGVEPQ
jgi:tripartite-type tricarboxylate transporter receptor subunit TctC